MILCNATVTDHFWPPVVPCFYILDAVRIVNLFYYNLTHVTTITHNYFLRCVTFTQLTILHPNIPFSHSLHNTSNKTLTLQNSRRELTPQIHFLRLLLKNTLVELLLKNWLLRHSSSSYKTLNRTSVTAATSQVRAVLRHSWKCEGHAIQPYPCCRVTSPRHVA
jgi:hypothetical protein